MTRKHLFKLFAHQDTFRDQNNLSDAYRKTSSADLDAFLLLDHLVPAPKTNRAKSGFRHDIIACAEHDQIWLNVDLGKLAAAATDEDITALQQLGVMLDTDTESLSMIV